MDDNVLVETNVNQNTSTEVNNMDSGVAITGDGMNIALDANVVHLIHQTAGMPSFKRGETPMDVSSLARPLQPQRPLLPTTVIPLEIKLVRRGMEADRTSI